MQRWRQNRDNGEQQRGKKATEKKTNSNRETTLTSSCPSCAQSHTSHTPYPEEQHPLEPTNSHLQGGSTAEAGWMGAEIMSFIKNLLISPCTTELLNLRPMITLSLWLIIKWSFLKATRVKLWNYIYYQVNFAAIAIYSFWELFPIRLHYSLFLPGHCIYILT